MKNFAIKIASREEYEEVKKEAEWFGYKPKQPPIGTSEWEGYESYINFINLGFLADYSPKNDCSYIFNWKNQRKETIEFMKDNIGWEEPKLSDDTVMNFCKNLQNRIEVLEKQKEFLEDIVWSKLSRRVHAVDKKLRERLYKLEFKLKNGYEVDKPETHPPLKGVGSEIGLMAGYFDLKPRQAKPKSIKTNIKCDDSWFFPDTIHPQATYDWDEPRKPSYSQDLSGTATFKEPTKIAIRVENEQEFNELMDIYEKKGWETIIGRKAIYKWKFAGVSNFVSFGDRYITFEEHLSGKYTIISLQTLKAILNA